MAVFGAVISYILQMCSFILLRVKLPNIARPFLSPFGLAGAVATLIIAAVTLVALFFADPVYQKVVIGAAIWYAMGLLYFLLHGRKQLVLSPEEEFAIKAREEATK
jgi:ethanolamine permease